MENQRNNSRPYDLRVEHWIPWACRDRVEWGPPSLLGRTQEGAGDTTTGISAPRPDFTGAIQEFLIGLLAVAMLPEDDDEWRERWEHPPTVEELQDRFNALPEAFDLDGDGPRFFQDLSSTDFADVEPTPIDQLLIESPGEQTMKLNKDLFIKRRRVERMGRPAAAMALLTMQTYAPAGGQGHRTSLRGGGPLTTLADPRVDREGVPDPKQPLWRKLWANVPTRESLSRFPSFEERETMEYVFPWLARTRLSNPPSGRSVTPEDANPLQAYFGLPRRIRLEFAGAGQCDLTGRDDDAVVTGFRMRNYGVQYSAWEHPLSPHYKNAKGEWLPIHGQPDGVAWRDWLGFTLRSPEAAKIPAIAVATAMDKTRRNFDVPIIRVHAFGFDMDNMKARGWTEAVLPAFPGLAPDQQQLVMNTAARLIQAADIASGALRSAVERALFEKPDDAPGDLSKVKSELWSATEAEFYRVVKLVAIGTATSDLADDEARGFAAVLERVSLGIFDRWCPVEAASVTALRRTVGARFSLVMTLRGKSKVGGKLFGALGITREETKAPPKKKAKARSARRK